MLDTQLLIIDAQNDFCDQPAFGHAPALPVPGAYQDCLRLAQFIGQAASGITGVAVTLDTHHAIDLAHNTSWLTENDEAPPAFSSVRPADLTSGRLRLASKQARLEKSGYVLQYLEALEQMGRPFTLWPPHCLIGSPGHNLNAAVAQALAQWESLCFKPMTVIQKGENIWTESFSALKAVIPDPADSATQLNQEALGLLARPDRVVIAGQASSHCVKETILDILQFGPAGIASKLVVLTDCMSPVPGFETAAAQFFDSLRAQGVRLAGSADIALELIP